MDRSDPLGGFLPEAYALTQLHYESNSLIAIYHSPSGEKLLFYVQPATGVMQVDSEDAEISKQFKLLSYDAVLVVEDGYTNLTWFREESMFICRIGTNGFGKTEVVDIAKQIIRKFSI